MEGLGSILPKSRDLMLSLYYEKNAVTVDFKLYLIKDRQQTRSRNLSIVVEQALKAGVKAVQLREKDLPIDELRRLAEEIRWITSLYGAKLLINGRADIARDIHADGVHLPQNGANVKAARKIIGPEQLIGMSCHNLDSAISALKSGADFITFGPVFFTPSKAVYGSPVGLERLAETTAILNIPVFGLGGINKSNILQVMAAGAKGIALKSAIMSAEQPQVAAETLLKILNHYRLKPVGSTAKNANPLTNPFD
jgi:thiamine-phosphate pyrophosphorylase